MASGTVLGGAAGGADACSTSARGASKAGGCAACAWPAEGTDITTGGGGADIFSYKPNFGQAVVTDFTSGTDQIALPSSEFANYAYLQSHNSLVGGYVMLTGSNGDTLTLYGVTALPGQSNFQFS